MERYVGPLLDICSLEGTRPEQSQVGAAFRGLHPTNRSIGAANYLDNDAYPYLAGRGERLYNYVFLLEVTIGRIATLIDGLL